MSELIEQNKDYHLISLSGEELVKYIDKGNGREGGEIIPLAIEAGILDLNQNMAWLAYLEVTIKEEGNGTKVLQEYLKRMKDSGVTRVVGLQESLIPLERIKSFHRKNGFVEKVVGEFTFVYIDL